MKLYTMFSKTHKPFTSWFETIKTVEPTLEVISTEVEQNTCPTGEFNSEGWNAMMKIKSKMCLDVINSSSDNSFIYSDTDVQFFNPFTHYADKILADFDIVFQNDYIGGPCAGFFFSKINKRTKNLFEKTLEIIHSYRDDQVAMQVALRLVPDVKWAYLPKEFFTFGYYYQHWNEEKINFKVPKNLILHHANWVVGIEKKIKLLEAVRLNYNNKNFI